MTKTLIEVDLEWDVHDCRECVHRRVFDDGTPYCTLYNLPPQFMPRDGCAFGTNKKRMVV